MFVAVGQGFAQVKSTAVTVSKSGAIETSGTLSQYGSVYKMSRIYDMAIEDILKRNGISTLASLKNDEPLQLTINAKNIKLSPVEGELNIGLYYTIKQGETLYRVAKTYFGKSVQEVIELNKLKTESLAIGSRLLIGYLSSSEINASDINLGAANLGEGQSEMIGPKIIYQKERGIAYVNKGSKNNGMFVLHSTAKISSDVELYNPLRKTTVRAKVIGRIPEGTYMNDIDVVLSSGTANSLGALDGRFMIDIKYQEQ